MYGSDTSLLPNKTVKNMTCDHFQNIFARSFVIAVLKTYPGWKPPKFAYYRNESSRLPQGMMDYIYTCISSRTSIFLKKYEDMLGDRLPSRDIFKEMINTFEIAALADINTLASDIITNTQEKQKSVFSRLSYFCVVTAVFSLFLYAIEHIDVSEIAIDYISKFLFELEKDRLIKLDWLDFYSTLD